MVYLSKSKYCGLWQCPKIAWLRKFKPEELNLDTGVLNRMETGNEVGDLAMRYFGNYVEVTSYKDGKLDLQEMIKKTRLEMEKGTSVICEASFEYNGLYCAVDILKKSQDSWEIYEVKSSVKHSDSKDDKPVYIADIAYQKYVLENCGVKLTGTYLMCLNGDYVFDGVLNIHELFTISNVAESVISEEKNIAANLSIAERILNSTDEPAIDLSVNCHNPYKCGFWNYCTRHLPERSVFDLYKMAFSKKIEYYRKGLVNYRDLMNSSKITNAKHLRQIEYYLYDKGTYIEKDNIRDFLRTLSYPLYFLDFETMQPAIPKYEGTKPYTQIPFQYSLHYIEHEGGKLMHKEFLAESGPDPRRALAEQLCADIPMDVCVTAYNKAFECTRIKELATMFPDLSEHLLNIKENIVDLLIPFQSGYYYNREMGGSFSIKSVLPAIFPDDPSLDYHNLDGVHNGSEAMNIYPKIQFMEPYEQTVARKNLLKYCELDTYAMVKVWKELRRVSEEI